MIAGFSLAALLFSGVTANAQTTGTSDVSSQVQALLDQIKVLQDQLEVLMQLQQQVNTAVQDVQGTLKLVRQLRQGMSGDDITLLQELLASDPSIYPEGLVTGYFGPLTAKAVRAYQRKHGLEQVGEVGPKTRNLIDKWLTKLWRDDDDNDEDEDGDDDNIKLHPSLVKRLREHKALICHRTGNGGGQTLAIAKMALSAHLAHGDILGECGSTTPPVTTTPDTTPPIISNLTATSTSSTTVSVTWNTNETATSKVWYSTTTPLVLDTASMVSSASLITSHDVSLTNLPASTTHYFIAVSSDASENTATSSESSFATP